MSSPIRSPAPDETPATAAEDQTRPLCARLDLVPGAFAHLILAGAVGLTVAASSLSHAGARGEPADGARAAAGGCPRATIVDQAAFTRWARAIVARHAVAA